MDGAEYLFSLKMGNIRPGLERVEKLCEALGHPQFSYPTIHIAGTNGKGSVAAYLAQALIDSGYRVGLYTSPHLVTFNERIRVNHELISDIELDACINEVRKVGEGSFFEFSTAVAFLHFAKKKVDIAIIETGMGGKFDATNVVKPVVSVITHVSFDHMEYLGDTLEKIALEKSGIIKEGVVVCGEKNLSLKKIFFDRANAVGAKFVDVSKFEVVKISEGKFVFEGEEYALSLLGDHQIDNAAIALGVLFELKKLGWRILDLKKSLRMTSWRGRLEEIAPDVFVDGAHNVSGVEALASYLKKNLFDVLVLGISKHKEYEKMIATLAPLFRSVIVTESNFKPEKAEVLGEVARKYCSDVVVERDLHSALAIAKSKKGKILIAGSLYLVGNVLERKWDTKTMK